MSASIVITWLAVVLISTSSTFGPRAADAKPVGQNQVKFRRLPPKEFSAALGSSITIECEAGASPPPTIHWLKDGKRIEQNDLEENQLEDEQQTFPVDDVNRIALSSTRSRLYIDCADLKDEATYTCVAENEFSRVSSHTKLNLIRPSAPTAPVRDENDLLDEPVELAVAGGNKQSADDEVAEKTLSAIPQCLSQRSTTTEQARIHMWTHNIVEIMNNNVVLFCRSNVSSKKAQQVASRPSQSQDQQTSSFRADKIPSPKTILSPELDEKTRQPISWVLPDDKLVTSDMKDKYEILETGDLLIKDLRWSDLGNYVCTVSNEHSSDSVSTFVYPAAVKVNSKRIMEYNLNRWLEVKFRGKDKMRK